MPAKLHTCITQGDHGAWLGEVWLDTMLIAARPNATAAGAHSRVQTFMARLCEAVHNEEAK